MSSRDELAFAKKGCQPLNTCRVTAVGLLITGLLLVLGIVALPNVGPVVHAGSAAEDDLGQSAAGLDAIKSALLESQLVTLDLPSGIGEGFTFMAAIDEIAGDEPVTFELWPHTNRSPQFRVRAQMDDGSLVEVDAGEERTLRGRIVESPGSVVAASLLDDGLHALVMLPEATDVLWIEPVSVHVKNGAHDPALHVAYLSKDAVCAGGVCGVEGRLVDPLQTGITQPPGDGPQGGIAGSEPCETVEIAIDVDFTFVQIWGNQTNALNRVNTVINNTNAIYESHVGIKHLITEIIVRTSSGANPYSCSTGDGSASDLLDDFSDVWTSAPESQISRDVAHLFTGCTGIDADGIAQLGGANVPGNFFVGVCRPNHYGLSTHQGFLSCQTHVTSHELGHNWSAQHCDGTTGCSGTIMPAFFPPCSSSFSGFSQDQILSHKHHSTFGACTESCEIPPTPPSNDTCSSSLNIFQGTTPISNVLASTEGPTEPLCDLDGDATFQSDVWFRHTAQCTGTLVVRTCGSNPGFDSKIALYPVTCPTEPGTALGCNNDSCGQHSSVSIPVVQGSTYRIRVGGHNGAQGEANLTISCFPDPEPDPCPADLTGDGAVGVPDLLALLGAWGPCGDCDADLTGDGSVGVPDLLDLLGAWGACP